MGKSKRGMLVLSLISLAVFFVILVSLRPLMSLDVSVSTYFLNLNNSGLIELSKAVGWIFDPISIILVSFIIAGFIYFKGLKEESFTFSLVMIISGLYIFFIKEIVQRARPSMMIEKELSFSFPSGHILAAVVFFGFFIYLSIRYLKSKNLKFILTTLFIFTTLMIGISRLILNVHWLSDLIGGLFLGLFLVLGAIFIKEKYVSD